MSPGKHDPAPLQSYLKAHTNHMDQLARAGVVARDGLAIQQRGDSLIIAGEVEIHGGAVVRVHKEVPVVHSRGSRPFVQTRIYTYNVHIPGVGSIVRHDGPDEHRDYHHVHRFDLFAGDREGTLEAVEWDDVPTLAEVIRAAYDWCARNRARLDAIIPED